MESCYDSFELSMCRLCLKMKLQNDCSILTEDNRALLKVLIPEINVPVNTDHESNICNICSDILQTADKFKKDCISNDSQRVNSTDESICSLCQRNNVDVQEKHEAIRLKDALHKCFPDLTDFKENSSCCRACSKLIEDVLTFIENCQKTEEDIGSCLSTGKDSQKTKLLDEVSAVIPPDSTTTGPAESTSKKVDKTKIGVKKNATTSKRKRPRLSKNATSTNKYNCANCSYSSNYKSALISHMVSHRVLSEATSFKCEVCQHQTKRIADLRTHMIIHKDPSELKMFKCPHCPYQSKRNCDLKHHILSHGLIIYQCEHCPYQTADKYYLENAHMHKHKDKPKLKVLKCKQCPYQTTNKFNLRPHVRLHKKELFKCNWCAFTTYRRHSLKNHMYLLHSPASEMNMFKCANCEYQTKLKESIKRHMLLHMDSSLRTVKCDECNKTYKTKQILKIHMREMHGDPSELQFFQCHTCGFIARRKASIKSHIFNMHRFVR